MAYCEIILLFLKKADYQEKVDKELKTLLRQKEPASDPGFRKGMVPTSLGKRCMVSQLLPTR